MAVIGAHFSPRRLRARRACARVGAQAPAPISPFPTPRDWSGQNPIQYPDPDIVALDDRVPPLHRRQHVDQAAAHRHAVGGRPGVERRRPLSGVERHPQQRADALDRGRRPRHGVPQSVRLQQRQHVRLRGPAAFVRARRPPRRALRAQRHGHRDRRQVSGQAAQLAQRRRRASRRRHLVHRSELRHPRQLRRLQGRVRRPRKPSIASTRKTGQIDKVTDEIDQPERPLLLARLQEALRRRHRHGPRHPRLRRRRQDAAQRQALRPARHSRHRRAVGRRRHPLRRRRQHLGGRAARRAGDRAQRRTRSA